MFILFSIETEAESPSFSLLPLLPFLPLFFPPPLPSHRVVVKTEFLTRCSGFIPAIAWGNNPYAKHVLWDFELFPCPSFSLKKKSLPLLLL